MATSKKILDFLPTLIALGQGADPQILKSVPRPKAWDYGEFWSNWGDVLKEFTTSDLENLIRGFVLLEKVTNEGFGSIPPVARIFSFYSGKVTSEQSDSLANWILATTINEYVPYGTKNFGAKSLQALEEVQEKRKRIKNQTRISEDQRQLEAKNRKAEEATLRLPQAIRRKDKNAVLALIARGANAEAISSDGQTSRKIAAELGIEDWLLNSSIG